MSDRKQLRLLFVCSMNQWRSPTAEAIYSRRAEYAVRSRGTNKGAKQLIRGADLDWADVVFVMEDKHKHRLMANFPSETKFKLIHVLDIPDDYRFMDDDLIEEIQAAVDPILQSLNDVDPV